MSLADQRRFADLTYDDFRRLAMDASASAAERVGFPDGYRAGYERVILEDIQRKLPVLSVARQATVVDIGAGAGDLAVLVRELAETAGHRLVFVDSDEVLAHHADDPRLLRVAGPFPDCAARLGLVGEVDALLVYSVIQYVPADELIGFLDAALALLAPGGRLLIGDVPNASMRERFLRSEAGRSYHRAYVGRDEDPDVDAIRPQPGDITDDTVAGVIAHARGAGFHAWVVPQASDLPMSNRREDVLIERP